MAYTWRTNIVLILFFSVSAWVLISADALQRSIRPSISQSDIAAKNADRRSGVHEFTWVDYYVEKSTHPSMVLHSAFLRNDSVRKQTWFDDPDGEVYTLRDPANPILYSALHGEYSAEEQLLHLNDDVVIEYKKANLESDRLTYHLSDESFTATGHVHSQTELEGSQDTVTVNAERVDSWPQKKLSVYRSHVNGSIQRFRRYESPVFFWTDQLSANLKENVVDFLGNVKIVKDKMTAESMRGNLFLDNYNKKLKYYVLYDDVRLQEKLPSVGGVEQIRKAFSERLEGHAFEKRIVLMGAPKVYQGKDVIKGNKITLTENAELIEIDDSSSLFYLKERSQ